MAVLLGWNMSCLKQSCNGKSLLNKIERAVNIFLDRSEKLSTFTVKNELQQLRSVRACRRSCALFR